MDQTTADALISNALVNIALGVGGALIALCTFVAVMAYRMGKGLEKRDAAIATVAGDLAKHEKECAAFRNEVARQFNEGSKQFRQINRSLGRIEGKLGIEGDRHDD